jgi:hypothetical protein
MRYVLYTYYLFRGIRHLFGFPVVIHHQNRPVFMIRYPGKHGNIVFNGFRSGVPGHTGGPPSWSCHALFV